MQDLLHKTLLSQPLKRADISFVMVEEDQELVSHYSKHPLIPASNTKLFISAAALLSEKKAAVFPPLQTFAHGPINQGTLEGDLILDSCGSLIFSARFSDHDDFDPKNRELSGQIERYSAQLMAAGITTINGDIKLSFERWNAPPENKHYNAAAAFSFNENTVDTLIEDGVVQTVPQNPAVFRFESTHAI